MPYNTQYNPYLDLAGAVQGPAAGLARVLSELPQQRAQARLMQSQFDENQARIGLLGMQTEQTERETPYRLGLLQAQRDTELEQGRSFAAQARGHTADAVAREELTRIAAGLGKLSSQAAQEFASGKIGTNATQFIDLMAQANALDNTQSAMPNFVQSVNMLKAGGDPVALSNVQAGGRGIPFNRVVGPSASTPITLNEGQALFEGIGRGATNAPAAPMLANPRVARPGSTSSVDAAYIAAVSRIVQEGLRARAEGIADPAEIDAQVAEAIARIPRAAAGVGAPPVGLPSTNAPVRIRSITPLQ